MRHHHHGHAFLRELNHHVKHFVNHFRVESRSRFVEQHADRVHRERPGDCHTLLLAAGELSRILFSLLQKTDTVEKSKTFLRRFFAVSLEHLHLRENKILADREVREELEMLEHHADVAAEPREVRLRIRHLNAVHENGALLHRFKAVHRLDEGGFAGTGRTADHDNLSLPDAGRAVFKDLEAAVPLRDIADVDHGSFVFINCHEKFFLEEKGLSG